MPELVWALVFVSAFGLGAPAGVLAISIVSVGFMGRFYAESLEVVDMKVAETVTAHGAGWGQVRLYGVLAQAMPDMVGTSLYLLDHNLRAATLLGLVGAGGIGYDMIVALKLFRFDRLSLIVLAILVGIAWDLGFRPALMGSMLSDMGQYLARYRHPDFSHWRRYIALLGQTLSIAAWGTTLSFLLSFAFAPCAARNFAPSAVAYHAVRHVQTFFRAMPDLLLALIFVSAIGLGPMPGVLALALHTSGFLGKLFAENLERVDQGSCEALRASGAEYVQILAFAGWRGTVRETIGYTLYIFDRNVRMAMVLGLVGAGGIGRTLHDTLRVFRYDQASAVILLVLATIVAIDMLSNWLRRKAQ